MIRVLVAEDSEVTRLGIVTMLSTQADLQVVAQAEDGAQAVVLFRQHRPDVTLVDMRMPALDGVAVTAAICAEQPPGRVLVLTNYEGDENIFQALKAGASGYLTKGARGMQLVEAIRAVHAGQKFLPPEMAQQLAQRVLTQPLGLRETQILKHIALGQTNVEIADALGLSKKTIGMFVGRLLFKLGVHSRTEAVTVAMKRGILKSQE
jgi:two-component system, NarL family, response regulator